MIIKNIYGITLEEIQKKKYNIFLGISIDNKYFTKDNIRKYLEWMLKHTKKYIAVLIADEIQAINYEIFENLSKENAQKKADLKGQEFKNIVKEIINPFPKDTKNRIFIMRWREVKDKYYKEKIKIIKKEFKENKDFHDFIISYVKRNLGSRSKGFSDKELDYLAQFLLDEIPIVLNGIRINNIIFDLHPYPGKGISKIFIDLQNEKIFPDLSKKLNITHKIASLEAYV